jgi:CRISPR-associated endonuclease/helicase Cas3
MEAALNKAERLAQLEQLLIAHPQGLKKADIARRLGVNRSTITRYIDELSGRHDSPIPIYDDDGLIKINRDKYLNYIGLTVHEAMAVHLATRLMATRTDKHNRHAAAALRKLGQSLETFAPLISRHVTASANTIDDAARRQDENYMRTLEILTRAWSDRQMVRVWHRYEDGGKVYKYDFAPYFIEPYAVGQTTHVIGQRIPPNALRTFKLERIERIELLPKTYTIPADFDAQARLADAWGIWYTDNPPVDVALKFQPGVAGRVKETQWHTSETITDQPDGAIIWRANIAEPREMLPWIRGWGADCEVLEPKALRKALEREARQLAAVYGVAGDYNSKQFYAHSKDDVDESQWQLLIDHLRETAELAFQLGEDAGVSELARTAGMLHDLGKYSKEFQARLRGSNRRVDHATAGAREIMKLFPDRPQKDFAEILSYCIAGHHSGLPDYGSMADTADNGTLLARREKKKLKNYDAYKAEMDTKLLSLSGRSLKPARFRLDEQEKQYIGFSISFLTRMVFSALVDADWLDTERYMQDAVKPRGQHANISTLANQFNRFLQRFNNPQNDLNRKRTETLEYCLTQADVAPGIFTLTVPTGGGKTYASMAFALNHAIKYGLKRVIYVIPFTGIIEQNAAVFREALGDLGPDNILEHHSNFDWDGKRKNEDDESNSATAKLKLAAENWDIPIVVTTNVQFFESLFASKKRSARKLHNIAKSVIIFDEVQVLPRDYLKPSLLAIQELVQNYGASAVFCTATQPSLQQFFPAEERTKIQFTELASNPSELFDFFRRVRVENLATQTDGEIISALQRHRQALCIVNTRKHANGLFAQLDGDGNFHLSTLMCPAHRTETMQEIRERLADGRPCRVVSTQVMEAGIDLDFPVGYRAMAGLDSIIQAAGRVNREGKQTSGTMFVFTPKTEFIKRTPTFIAQTGAVAAGTLAKFTDDPTSIQAIEAYYRQLYTLQGEESFDAKNILGYFDKGTGQADFDFKTAAEKFKLIEDNTLAVIIPYNDEAKGLIETLKYTAFPASVLRKLQTYTVNIYEREFMNLESTGVILTIDEQYHVLDEKWMGAEEYYHPQTGLMLPAGGGGEAVFFD